ncbi:ATP-binding protein [Kistimonas asteriae]|uniref:ATP-binding protein n=1 Tax=Kistimonas asteriae TaxID=517724 RepID=UPI001BA6B4BF|nr:ATP-binding protein [Kistimonas asteriae]
MEPRTQTIQLLIDSRLEDTVLVAMAIRGLCAMTGLTAEEVNRVELCVVEITNNAIEHAYSSALGNAVEVVINLSTDELEIVVSDWGQAMAAVQSSGMSDLQHLTAADPESWSCSGRGLNIVEQLMDDVSYISSDGKNSFYMSKNLN